MKEKVFPIQAIVNNMVQVTNGKVWAYYHIQSDFVMRVDTAKKAKLKQKVKHVLEDLSQFGSVDIRLLPRDMTISERFDEVVDSMPDDTKKTVDYYLNRLRDDLTAEMGQLYVYDWLIGVPLSARYQNNIGMELKESGKQFITMLAGVMGFEVDTSDWVKQYEEIEKDVYSLLATVGATRVKQDDMFYLTRYNFIRNMPHTLETEKQHVTIKQVIDGVLDFSEMGRVHLGNYNGESYVAFLPLAATSDILDGKELGEMAQFFSFPVELQYQVFYEKKESLFGGIKYQKERAKDRVKNALKDQYFVSGDLSLENVNTKDILEDMENCINKKDMLFVGWTATLVVYGETVKQLKSRIDDVIGFCNKQGLEFSRGSAEQYELFMKAFFGQVEKETSYWYQVSTLDGFCENLLFVNNRVGTKTGFYIGRVNTGFHASRSLETALDSSRNIVLLNPSIINKGLQGSKTDSPHIVVTGETGKGKSFLINLLHFWQSFFTKSIYIDVKNEKKERYLDVIHDETIRKEYPLLVEHIEKNFAFVELDANKKEYHGVLDPLLFTSGVDSTMLAISIMQEVYDFKGKDKQERLMTTYINEVAEQNKNGKKQGLMNVLERLIVDEDDMIKECGLLIKEKVKGSILRLLFGNEETNSLSFDTKHTILGFQGMDLPDVTVHTADYKPSQRYSMLVMYAVGAFSKVFGSNRHEFTVSYIDEAWVYFSTSVGKTIMKEMKRIGRSYNNALVLGTQSVKDFSNSDELGNFGTFFAFDEPSERQDILKFLGLPTTTLNEVFLQNLIKGECLYKDNYGRVQKIIVHCPFWEVARLFITVDKTTLSELEHKYI